MRRLLFFISLCVAHPLLYAGDPPLIDVKTLAPNIRVEMRYATRDNFTGTVLYDAAVCLLSTPAAERLARVQKNLEKKGLGLKVWDCYRPLDVQEKLWAIVPDDRYVANPKSGSRHNRGASVDLTLVDKNGHELEMPTPFDDFSPAAHRNNMNASATALKNRALLETAMTAEGFVPLATEWWHFDDPEWKNYALRNEPLSSPQLAKDLLTPVAHFALPETARQVLLVTAVGWDATTGRLQRFERIGKKWEKAGAPWTISLGTKGMAWGQGLHNAQTKGPQKKEGDLKAPAGVFPLGASYGYAASPPEGTIWPYTQVDETWRCIDDPTSRSYNLVKAVGSQEKKDWTSAETMKRSDHLYKWVINVEQNFPNVLRGCGSCIFLHVWRRPDAPTEGCTAMPEEKMTELLRWLDTTATPLLIQLPESEYRRLKKTWRLP